MLLHEVGEFRDDRLVDEITYAINRPFVHPHCNWDGVGKCGGERGKGVALRSVLDVARGIHELAH
jgi:hypothetical protein